MMNENTSHQNNPNPQSGMNSKKQEQETPYLIGSNPMEKKQISTFMKELQKRINDRFQGKEDPTEAELNAAIDEFTNQIIREQEEKVRVFDDMDAAFVFFSNEHYIHMPSPKPQEIASAVYNYRKRPNKIGKATVEKILTNQGYKMEVNGKVSIETKKIPKSNEKQK